MEFVRNRSFYILCLAYISLMNACATEDIRQTGTLFEDATVIDGSGVKSGIPIFAELSTTGK